MNIDFSLLNDDDKILISRLDDLIIKSSGGILGVTQFLNPRQAQLAKQFLLKHGYIKKALFWGGYSNAERTRLFLLPEYLMDILMYNKISQENLDNDSFINYVDLGEGYLTTLKVTGSSYYTLTHRDYLGAILALGIKRDVVGDIIISDAHSAYIILDLKISKYIKDNLEKVASDKVDIAEFNKALPTELISKLYEPFCDTISSNRLDCIIASVFNLSRDDAQKLVKSAKVEVNFRICPDVDSIVEINSIISAKGFGRFVLRNANERTKKGKIKLIVDKYI